MFEIILVIRSFIRSHSYLPTAPLLVSSFDLLLALRPLLCLREIASRHAYLFAPLFARLVWAVLPSTRCEHIDDARWKYFCCIAVWLFISFFMDWTVSNVKLHKCQWNKVHNTRRCELTQNLAILNHELSTYEGVDIFFCQGHVTHVPVSGVRQL